jgi:hypothetical protein
LLCGRAVDGEGEQGAGLDELFRLLRRHDRAAAERALAGRLLGRERGFRPAAVAVRDDAFGRRLGLRQLQ